MRKKNPVIRRKFCCTVYCYKEYSPQLTIFGSINTLRMLLFFGYRSILGRFVWLTCGLPG